MANNPYVNKVEYDGQTLMDLTGDTVTPSSVLNGVTFHDRSGAQQTGSMITHNVYDDLDSTSTDDALSANQGKVLNDKIEIFQLNTPVNLNDYTAGNLYRFTMDGYLSVDAGSGDVIFRLYSYSNGRYIYNTITNQSISVFVKKNMQVDIRAKTGTTDIKFYPISP